MLGKIIGGIAVAGLSVFGFRQAKQRLNTHRLQKYYHAPDPDGLGRLAAPTPAKGFPGLKEHLERIIDRYTN